MPGITLEKGKQIYVYGQPMTALHLVTGGRITVDYPGGSYQLAKGDVIGICEICLEVHLLSYTVSEDACILTYPLSSLEALEDLLAKHPDVARLFLLSAFRQFRLLLERSAVAKVTGSTLYQELMEDYTEYSAVCSRNHLRPRNLEGLEELTDYFANEEPDIWLSGFYLGLYRIYADEKYRPLASESAVAMGFLRKCSLDSRRALTILEGQHRCQQQLLGFCFNESGNDLFGFYTELYYKLEGESEEVQMLRDNINRMISKFAGEEALQAEWIRQRVDTFRESLPLPGASVSPEAGETASEAEASEELSGSLDTILRFAGSRFEAADSFRTHVLSYKALPDRESTDPEPSSLRRALTQEFYGLYTALFEKSLHAEQIPVPVRMFLYFGYVDEGLAGAENASRLYHIMQSLLNPKGKGVYTFYDWLMAIYRGKKEPSRDEFEQDYSDYLHKLKASRSISEQELRHKEKDRMARVRYELENMFLTVNKTTFGRIASFCPLFTADNVLKDLEEALVTPAGIRKILNQIRRVDYSAFYREGMDTENIDVMGKEPIHREYLPDVILMPNMGIRGVMWQEIEGRRRNSPGRMMLSLFHMEALETTMIRLVAEFRWALCRRIQGARWNDLSEPSLTSEYFDYIQFYRRNRDLSPEAKERVRSSLQRCKNSFREMFVRDYVVWIMFEGTGSPRLNKVARQILFTYCPFSADICDMLEQNPLYAEILARRKVKAAQRLHHLDVLEKKLLNSNTPVPDTLYQERKFVAGKVEL